MVNFEENGVTTPQKILTAYAQHSIFLAHDVKYTSLTSKWPQKVFFSFFLAYNGQFWGKQGHDPPQKSLSAYAQHSIF